LDIQLHPNSHNLVENIESRYGELSVTELGGQFNFYQNNLFLFSSDQTFNNEESVHFAMLQHSNPENILAISGNLKEILRETDKYPISSIDYIAIDPLLINLKENHINVLRLDKKANIIKQDPRTYLTRIDKKYDVVLINLPDPENIQINRYFTLDFFEEIKNNLSYSGILSISLSGNYDYLDFERRYLFTSLFSTLKLVFSDVLIIPGQRNYFLASEMPLSHEISKLLKARGVFNKYLHPDYLDDIEIAKNRERIVEEIGNNILINYDFFPSLFSIKLKHWFRGKIEIVYLLLITFIIFYILIGRSEIANIGLITTGFSSSSLFIFIFMVFQAIYGYLFFMLGIFISVYFIGMATGLLIISKKIRKTFKNFSLVQYLLGIFAIIIPLIVLRLNAISASGFILQTMFVIFIIGIGIVSGIQNSMSSSFRLSPIGKNVRLTLGYDMIGNAIGFIVVPLLLVPLFGFIRICLIVGILNFIAGLWLLIKMKISTLK
jgi:spermidine synthase